MMVVLKARVGLQAVLVLLVFQTDLIRGELLTPPYFNLAEGKNITASATCGVGTEGPELYCKLIGANSDNDLSVNVIQGQYCDICDPARPDKMHPPEFAVDGMESWWQSPPLSRGMKYNEVNLTIDLGQEFHVAYVYIKMANSPRPGLWVLEKSADYGKTYLPWQYFSDSPADCETYFGRESLQPITRDDSVICSTEYSKIVPLEGGEIPISLLKKRPSANHYFNSTILQEWTRATNVRLRFLRTKNLLGHLMSVARQDPTVTRRYFYSIKDISIGGRCMCNGHADACDIPDPRDNKVLLCRCKHNTCGAKCDSCCPGFEQKAWRQSKHNNPFTCERCNCFQHSNECIYDKETDHKHLSLDIHGRYHGGGVCQNCQHNTEGINCNKCRPKYFRPYHKHWNETDVCHECQCNHFHSTGNCAEGSGRCECRKEFTPPNCDSCSFGYYDYPDCKPCECYLNGTQNLQCSLKGGDCTCLLNYGGRYCKECAPGFFNFPECTHCECDESGSLEYTCHQETGNCTCKSNYAGPKCGECKDGYYSYPECTYCNCDVSGTAAGICDKTNGKCICKAGYGGDRCDNCVLGFYGYPNCQPCNCSKIGSHASTCSAAGKCSCLPNYVGRTCEQCYPGYYNYPECKPCNCDYHGAIGVSCDQEGKCECRGNYDGQNCDVCKEGYYNFPACEECNCHPAGVVAGFAGCGSVPAGELCQCKERVEGRICDKCKPLYWNLNPNNPDGCEDCKCNRTGVLGGIAVCDTDNGQCVCKPSVITRSCSECADGTYDLREESLFGCIDCGCDVGGSVSNVCNKITGQCLCQNRVTGRTCKEPLQAHYFPTLYQYQYEVEDGHTPENSRVRYAYEEDMFPNFSWKGYAKFSMLQKEVIQDIFITKPSLYRMVLRFVNNNPNTVIGVIKITPDNPNDIEQYIKVQFRNTSKPAFVTVSGESGNTPKPFVMNPGRWSVSINVNQSVLLDYFVLLPEDFYLATILNQKIETPCTIDESGLCRHYAYPNITMFDKSWGVGGFIQDGKNIEQLNEYFQDVEHLNKIKIYNRVPLLNSAQPEITFNITVHKPGPYVIVVNYVTPLSAEGTHDVEVTAHLRNVTEKGNLKFYSCPFTTACRQVITNEHGGVAIYPVNSSFILLDLKSDNGNVGIHSIYAIPYEEWSLDYIKPKPVCIRKDGKCIPSSFRNPPETKKIQFEQEIEGELGKNRPQIREYNNTSYVWLNPSETFVDLKGKVPHPGYYTFVVHYYQPDFPDFDLNVTIQNGQFYEAKVPVRHCPSETGCRSVVTEDGRNDKFSLTENFMVTLKQPTDTKNVYLDYLLVVPADLYNDRNLEEEELDRTGEFISTCGNNHFNIDVSQGGFCRDSVFSITAGHNSGALPCGCDFYGTVSFECDKFGGQCHCKDHIIGRKCEACKTGYYGFPECKPCNCPSTAYCEPTTGQCICPQHVTGERCDQCEAFTYGYDPLIGCEECKCNYLGVNGSVQCDINSGECPCKQNVIGRPCDQCRAGYFSFPYCDSCECDLKGTTADVCDQVTAECFCKKFVVGPRCNFCREGSFNIQANNEEGCTECFCFGKTTRCTNSQLIKMSLIEMRDWKIVSINTTRQLNVTNLNITVENVNENVIGGDFSYFNASEKTAYFSAPTDYLGKKLTSYGGYLNYTIYYVIGPQGSAVSGPDVILEGAGTYLTYSNYEQPPAATEFLSTLQLVESNFELPVGGAARREHIMAVLKDLRGIYLRATYWTASVTTRLINVVLDEAAEAEYGVSLHTSNLAVSVEHCHCPPNYKGLSCEECAPGYYRIDSGPHGGYCVPCQCNGHAAQCDVDTGVCLNCTHNTRGDHCELCDIGYHGNALAGTPMDCLICACPLPIASNNFATACDLSADGEKISCDCIEGYIGARCHSCAPGFYGRPEVAGDYCKPCECSGNINPSDPSSCDTVTGACLRCLNNTFGTACSLCAPGYFGDAVNLKDCQACICDKFGTDHCDSSTGRCVCKPNVIGEKCDRCEIEHYGFQSGRGCIPCDCGLASDSDQCDDVNGQCKCRPGVTGRACDRCAAGYWNYTLDGCTSCGCKSEYSLGFGCNALTGQCECLQGVVGEKCDQCPHRWAFVPEIGCHRCDNCHHALLDDTDKLAALIDPIISDINTTAPIYFTKRRLESMREQLEHLKPKFNDVDPTQISIDETLQELESLEQDSKNLNRKSNYSLENSDSLRNQSTKLKDKLEVLLDEILQTEEESIKVIEEIEKIPVVINRETGNEVEQALREGQALLEAIKVYNFTEGEVNTNKQLDKVKEILNNVSSYKLPVEDLQGQVKVIKESLKDFNDKLDDLYNHTQYSLNMAKEAENIISRSGKDRFKSKLENIGDQIAQSNFNLNDSERILSNASDLIEISYGKLKELKDAPEVLKSNNNYFTSHLENNEEEIKEIQKQKPDVQNHATNLSERVQQLEHILSESQIGSEDAVKAARAYKDIVAAVKSAKQAADSAENDTSDAVKILNNVQERTNDAEQKSGIVLDSAHESNQSTYQKLKPKLDDTISKYTPVKLIHDKNDQLLKDIEKILDNIQVKDLSAAYKSAVENAEKASTSVEAVEGLVNTTFTELPKEKEQAQLLPKELNTIKHDLIQTDKQVVNVNEDLPPVLESLEKLPETQAEHKKLSDNIQNSIKKLNQQIELARDIANRIKVGVKFYPNTTLELRNPSNIEDLTTSTKVSGYFKTNKLNGLILYIGNPAGTNLPKTRTDDYMALVIRNGYPVLQLDIGNGPEQIINQKPVSDNIWYQFIIERVGHNAKLTIREQLANGTEQSTVAEKVLSDRYTIFNLDKDKSKIFVGSFPPHDYKKQDEIEFNSFEGEIEDLVIGNTPVSLWNFNYGYELHGAKERDKLVVLAPSTGYRFNGNGYVILDAMSFALRGRSTIQFMFKTFADNGLLILAGKGKTFVSIEIRNGKIVYQYNLGASTKKWVTSNSYNDGKWHRVIASREVRQKKAEGKLEVDTEDVLDRTSPITGTTLEVIETISFGGYPSKHNYDDVTEIKFEGCINNVTITGEPVDLRNNIQAFDVTPGCPPQFAQIVSFGKGRPGYVGWNQSVGNDFKVSLRFKTTEKDGLIFYVTDNVEENSISLSLRNGQLVLISQKIELTSTETFNDSQWHVISVTHNDMMLRIYFDDDTFKVTDAPPSKLHIMYATMYVGGVPVTIKPKPGTVGSALPFYGCIADLTVNGNVKNFANSTVKYAEYLDKCILDNTTHIVEHPVPIPPTPQPIPTLTTLSPDLITKNNFGESGTAGRGDTSPVNLPVFETVTPPVLTTTPKYEGCALPVDSSKETDSSDSYKFGTQESSRIEYSTPRGSYREKFDFSFYFKTKENDGILFYASDRIHQHYAAVYLMNGHVIYTFRGNNSPMVIKSGNTYDDDTWHLVEFTRDGTKGKLVVDERDVVHGQANGTNRLSFSVPFFLGGIRPENYNQVLPNLNTTTSFNGCIREFSMNSKKMEKSNAYGVIPCSDNIEVGTYFGGGMGSYIKLKERFVVGQVFNIKMDIKPRVDSAILVAAHGKRDYYVLELHKGQLRLTVENGKGPVTAVFHSPNNRYHLCDGQWHRIQAVKSKNVITLSVDNLFTDPRIGPLHSTSTDTGSALFLGGHRFLKKVRGIVSRTQYIGCIRNIEINNEQATIVPTMIKGNITIGYCPTN